MNKNSISAKISIFFALFVVLILAIAIGALNANRMHQGREFFERIRHDASLLSIEPKINEQIIINNKQVIILSQNETKQTKQTKTPSHRPSPPPHMPPPYPDEHRMGKPYIYEDMFGRVAIFSIEGKDIGIKDNASNYIFYLYFTAILATVLLGITLLYLAIIKSLRPLKELEKEIEAFGIGIKPQAKSNYPSNEIGKIQKAFHAASSKISGLLDAREIFLKNAAHELKTPIAKGVIVAHLLDDERQKTRLVDIFSSMTQIIDGIMTAEEVIAKGFSTRIEPILLRGFCEKIRKKLLLDSSELALDIEPAAIAMADPVLLEIALANLFENSVKFKSEGSVAVCSFNEGILSVKNLGEELEQPIERYFEPFFKETSIRNANGMGLGLYLAKKVLEIQGLKLVYKHRDGENCFTIG